MKYIKLFESVSKDDVEDIKDMFQDLADEYNLPRTFDVYTVPDGLSPYENGSCYSVRFCEAKHGVSLDHVSLKVYMRDGITNEFYERFELFLERVKSVGYRGNLFDKRRSSIVEIFIY